ncbi:MAG: malate dehydrogenase [Thermodesulfovibrionales bacterium]
MEKKVTIIGAGNVGATAGQLMARSGLADVVLFDIIEGVPQGKALDISQACALWGSASRVTGTSDYAETEGSDVVVITAGFPRKPGMSRDDLLHRNADVVGAAAAATARFSPGAVIIVVTNPMDAMAWLSLKASGFPEERVVGMGGVLDAARFRTFVAWELGVSAQDVEAMVLGGHGDLMVPLPKYTTVRGVPITGLLSEEAIARLVERTRHGGAEIVSLLKHGSAYYAPAAGAHEMATAILLDEKRLLPCSAYLSGEYGLEGIYAGVPAIIGGAGVEKVVELDLDEEEAAMLRRSAEAVRELTHKIRAWEPQPGA